MAALRFRRIGAGAGFRFFDKVASIARKANEMGKTNMEEAVDSVSAKRKKQIVFGVVAVVIVAAIAGMWVWHEQPSFCGTICHTPMNEYSAGYAQDVGVQGIDKWGNVVSDTNAMLAVSHREAGEDCLSCHVPTIGQQIGELGLAVSGDYYFPLDEASTESLMVNSGNAEGSGDQFCLKSGCHVNSDGSVMTRDDLIAATSGMAFNPHVAQHGEAACSDCHKSHRASVFTCTECHSEAEDELPSGWVDASTGKMLEKAAMA